MECHRAQLYLNFNIKPPPPPAAAPPPTNFCPHTFNFGATLLYVGDFSFQQRVFHRVSTFVWGSRCSRKEGLKS